VPVALVALSASALRAQGTPSGISGVVIADLNYTPPSYNAFDRVTDIDSPVRGYQDLGRHSAVCGEIDVKAIEEHFGVCCPCRS
jgi:hypothetical protein